MNKDFRKRLGDYGENLALRFYLEASYTLLEKQFRCKFGEIDLILTKDDKIYFVEVRTKTTKRFGFAEESISKKKIMTIRKVSQFYLIKHNKPYLQLQYDVVTIFIDKQEKKAHIHRISQAF